MKAYDVTVTVNSFFTVRMYAFSPEEAQAEAKEMVLTTFPSDINQQIIDHVMINDEENNFSINQLT